MIYDFKAGISLYIFQTIVFFSLFILAYLDCPINDKENSNDFT